MWKFSSAGRASALQAEGQRFEPDPGRFYASVAQSVEQGTENPRVGGSIPPGGTIYSNECLDTHLNKSYLSVKESKGGSWKQSGGIFQPAWLLPQQKRFRPEM